jgi:hypothetical protein
MKKYRITSIPQLSRGGDPGDKYYKDNNNQYKRTASGQWFVWNGGNWQYADQGFYQNQDLEKNKASFFSDDASWVTDKPKAPKPAITQKPVSTAVLTAKLPAEKKPLFKAPKSDTFTSETLQNVASKTMPQTDQEWENFREADLMYDNKRYFLSQEALAENYDDIAYRVAQDLQSKNPKLSFEEALEQAKNNSDLLNEKAYQYVSQDPEVVSRIAKQKGYSPSIREHSVKALDLNDPNHVEMDGRMPETVGEYFQRGADILFNPLDAIYYGMNPTQDMPINMYEYEKAKQQLGYEDGSDRAAMMTGIDFASWFNPIGQMGQAIKLLRPTGEAIYNSIENPSWETAGNAAFNVGMNALAFTGTKIPAKSAFAMPRASFVGYAKTPQLKYLTNSREFAFGNPYLEEAKVVLNLPGFKLATGKPPLYRSYPTVNNAGAYGASGFAKSATSTAVGLVENASNSLLSTVSEPHVVTQSPLTTITPALPKKQPLDLDAALAADEASAFTGTSDAYIYDIEKNYLQEKVKLE